jgi:hypothetical protein
MALEDPLQLINDLPGAPPLDDMLRNQHRALVQQLRFVQHRIAAGQTLDRRDNGFLLGTRNAFRRWNLGTTPHAPSTEELREGEQRLPSVVIQAAKRLEQSLLIARHGNAVNIPKHCTSSLP